MLKIILLLILVNNDRVDFYLFDEIQWNFPFELSLEETIGNHKNTEFRKNK